MSILVLGGAGYIGSHAVRQLLVRGKRPVVIDNLQTGHKQSLPEQTAFYQGDIRDKIFLRQVLEKEKIEAVIHFAANSIVGESMTEPLKYFNNNVYGTQILLETMIACGVKKIVFSSSAATYGEVEKVPITEDMPAEPTNAYGETKLMMEKIMKWCQHAYDLKYVSLRYFNVAGASTDGSIGEDHVPETHLIPLVLQTALGQREFITVFGDDYDTFDGTCIRDYIHVEDLIDAHLLALQYLDKGGDSDIFNLGSNQGFSVQEIIGAARQVTGRQIPVQSGGRRSGDPAKLIASAQKAREVLGWRPERTDIEQIIADAWSWHRSHPRGYQDKK